MRTSVPVGRIFGVPIRIHWTVLIVVAVCIHRGLGDPGEAIALGGSFLALMFLHDAAHVVVARAKRRQVMGVELRALHGNSVISSLSDREGITIAWAGVVAQLAVAIPAILWRMTMPVDNPAWRLALEILGPFNLVLAGFHLLPIPWLDGTVAWRILRRQPRWRPPSSALRGRQ
jgi:Zn-dependent protease